MGMTDHRFGEFRLDVSDERLWGPGGPIKLGQKAFRVLLRLVEQPGQLITKDELFSSVWDGTIVSESALTSVIKELRRALQDESKTPRFIESVYGRGYRFVSPVAVEKSEKPKPAVPARPPRAPAVPTEVSLGQPPLLYVAPVYDQGVAELQPYLGETLREEVLFTLSRFRDVRLVSDRGRGMAGDQPDLGERDYQLSLRLLGREDNVRAFVRLSRLSSGAIIWADTAELDQVDPGAQADQFVRRIAAAALPTLHDDVLRNLDQQPHDGYGAYFRNKLQMRCQDTLGGAQALAASWEELIERHPTLSGAYPPLIRLYNTDFCFTGFGSSGPEERARAYELARRAIALDPTDAHLHSATAWCHLWAGEAALARNHFEEALRLNPYNQTRLVEAATGFIFLDETERAGSLVERSRNLAPFAVDAPHEEQALLLLLRGEFASAAEEFALVRRGHPDDGVTREPPILSEFYALLAAAGAEAADLADRSRRWQQRMRARWVGEDPPGAEQLTSWVLNHNPFQSASRREWMLDLFSSVLAAAPPDPSHSRGPAHPETRSARPPAGAPQGGGPKPRP